jgi:hypothetical protein
MKSVLPERKHLIKTLSYRQGVRKTKGPTMITPNQYGQIPAAVASLKTSPFFKPFFF